MAVRRRYGPVGIAMIVPEPNPLSSGTHAHTHGAMNGNYEVMLEYAVGGTVCKTHNKWGGETSLLCTHPPLK